LFGDGAFLQSDERSSGGGVLSVLDDDKSVDYLDTHCHSCH